MSPVERGCKRRARVVGAEVITANTLAATCMQLGAGLAVAGAAVALRAGDAVAGGGQAAYTVAFCLLALVAGEALRMDPAAGAAARRPRPAAVPPASSGQAG
jgi:hypothetical protein